MKEKMKVTFVINKLINVNKGKHAILYSRFYFTCKSSSNRLKACLGLRLDK
jgi:hypothetical protein